MQKIMFFLMTLTMIHADVYDQKKILIINNLDEALQFEQPLLRNTIVHYPNVILAHHTGEIIVDIEKDWLLDTPLSVQYEQIIKYQGASMKLTLTKNKPSPDLSKPFVPGFECSLIDTSIESSFSIMAFGRSNSLCNTFYLY